MTLTHRNFIHLEIRSRLCFRNASSHSVQNTLPSSLLSNNVKIKVYKIIILPVVLYGCEIQSLTLGKYNKRKGYENGVLWRILGPKRDEVMEARRRLRNKELHNFIPPRILIDLSTQKG
jgi:hypothetical protein